MANYNERGRRLISCTSKDPFIHEYEAKGDDIDNQNKCNFWKSEKKRVNNRKTKIIMGGIMKKFVKDD